MPGGAPPKFETPELLEKAIEGYFAWAEEKGKPPAIVRMALHLGFISRQSIYDYAKRGEFSYVIKKAISMIEAFHEENVHEKNNTGSLFWLKCHTWDDQSARTEREKGDNKQDDKPTLEGGKELPVDE